MACGAGGAGGASSTDTPGSVIWWGTESLSPTPPSVRVKVTLMPSGANCAPGSARGLLVYLDLRRFQLVEAQHVSPLAERCGDLLPAQETHA